MHASAGLLDDLGLHDVASHLRRNGLAATVNGLYRGELALDLLAGLLGKDERLELGGEGIKLVLVVALPQAAAAASPAAFISSRG